MKNHPNHYRKIIADCAAAGIKKSNQIAMRGGWPILYLYCTNDKKLVLLTKEEANEKTAAQYMLLTTDVLPPSLPYDKFYQWVAERSHAAPVL